MCAEGEALEGGSVNELEDHLVGAWSGRRVGVYARREADGLVKVPCSDAGKASLLAGASASGRAGARHGGRGRGGLLSTGSAVLKADLLLVVRVISIDVAEVRLCELDVGCRDDSWESRGVARDGERRPGRLENRIDGVLWVGIARHL